MTLTRGRGRPKLTDGSAKMVKVTFRLDEATAKALEALEEKLDSSIVNGRRSALLRKLILDEFDKIK